MGQQAVQPDASAPQGAAPTRQEVEGLETERRDQLEAAEGERRSLRAAAEAERQTVAGQVSELEAEAKQPKRATQRQDEMRAQHQMYVALNPHRNPN